MMMYGRVTAFTDGNGNRETFTGIPESSGRRRALRLPAAAGTATRWIAPGGAWSLKMQMASAALPITTMTFCAWRQTRLVLPQGIFTSPDHRPDAGDPAETLRTG